MDYKQLEYYTHRAERDRRVGPKVKEMLLAHALDGGLEEVMGAMLGLESDGLDALEELRGAEIDSGLRPLAAAYERVLSDEYGGTRTVIRERVRPLLESAIVRALQPLPLPEQAAYRARLQSAIADMLPPSPARADVARELQAVPEGFYLDAASQLLDEHEHEQRPMSRLYRG